MASAMSGPINPKRHSPTEANRMSTARLVNRTESGILDCVTPAGASWSAQPGLDDMDIIRLSVPGKLGYRDVVLRVVTAACRHVRGMALGKQEPSREQHDFDDKVVSALSEAFNNVAIHAYRGMTPGLVELEIEASAEGITLHMCEAGHAFEPRDEAKWTPEIEALPESHMGL